MEEQKAYAPFRSEESCDARLFVAVALSSLGLAACGTSGGSGNKALKIGTEFPVSGTDAAVTLPAQYGVDLAVQQNKDLGNGYTLDVVHKNDEGTSGADPSIGAANIQQLIADSRGHGDRWPVQ